MRCIHTSNITNRYSKNQIEICDMLMVWYIYTMIGGKLYTIDELGMFNN